jgi:hypothetical protein
MVLKLNAVGTLRLSGVFAASRKNGGGSARKKRELILREISRLPAGANGYFTLADGVL